MPSITPGKYVGRAIVEEADFGDTQTGQVQIALPFEITEGECSGMRWTWFGTFSERGTELAVKALRACGFEGNDLEQLGPLDKPVQLVFGEDEYQGTVSLKLKWINPLGGGKVNLKAPLSAGARAAFARRMRSVIGGLPADGSSSGHQARPAGAPRQATLPGTTRPQFRPGQQPKEPPETFDEVPF